MAEQVFHGLGSSWVPRQGGTNKPWSIEPQVGWPFQVSLGSHPGDSFPVRLRC